MFAQWQDLLDLLESMPDGGRALRLAHELQQQEREFRTLIENAPDVILRFDRELRYAYVNRAIESITGIPARFFIGKTPRQMGIPEDVVSSWQESLQKVFASGGEDVIWFSLPTSSGSSKDFQSRVVPEFAEDGTVESALVVCRDITAMQRVVSVLQESEARFGSVSANVPGMVFQMLLKGDRSVVFPYVSEGSIAVCGLAPAAIQGDPPAFSNLVHLQDRDDYYDSLQQSQKNLTPWRWEGRLVIAGGGEEWVNLRAIPRLLEDGAVLWDGIVFDITESKQTEEMLIKSGTLLRDLAAHHESVREEERRRIAREVHDELGQSLTALKIDISLLEKEHGYARPALSRRIMAILKHVDLTIEDVRNIAADLRPAVLDLGLVAAIEWQVDEFRSRSGIECELVLEDDEEMELSNGVTTAVFRILQESLTNIIRHAAATRVRIILKRENGMLLLKIEDNGKGFQEGDIKKTKSFGLLGIKERALMLGGEFAIESDPGKGTALSIAIPVAAGLPPA